MCQREKETLTRAERALVDGYTEALQTIAALQQQAPNAGASQTIKERDLARLEAADLRVNLNDVTVQRDVARHANEQTQDDTAKWRIKWLVQRQVDHLVKQADWQISSALCRLLFLYADIRLAVST